jgi:copper(I)-binding protein
MSYHYARRNLFGIRGRNPRLIKAALAVCAVLLFLLPMAAQDAAVTARDPWVRLPLPSKNETALFVVLENHSAERRKLVGASSDAAETAELHEMKMQKTLMVMTPVADIAIPAKGKASLDPNGYHLMLFGLKNKLAVGDVVHVTLKFDDGSTLPVTAPVRK